MSFKQTFHLLVWKNIRQAIVVKILLATATVVIVSCCQVLGTLLFRMPTRYKLGSADSSFLTRIFLISSHCWMIYFQLGQQILSSIVVVINFLLYIHLLGWWHVAIFILPSDTSICRPTSAHSLSYLKVYWTFAHSTSYSERVDDNCVRLSMEAGTVRVWGLMDKHNFLVNALTGHIRIFFFSVLYIKIAWHQSPFCIFESNKNYFPKIMKLNHLT